jgi:hypothetical protein
MSINNVEAFAGHFNVEQCYTSNVEAALWFDFGAKAGGRGILESMRVTAVTRADTIEGLAVWPSSPCTRRPETHNVPRWDSADRRSSTGSPSFPSATSTQRQILAAAADHSIDYITTDDLSSVN